MTSRAHKYVADAKSALKRGDEAKWEAAEKVWRANKEEGASQREIASVLNRAQRTVGTMIALWDEYGERVRTQVYVDYTEAYYELRGFRTHAVPEASARAAAPAEAARIVRTALARPEVREQLAAEGAEEVHSASVDVAAREDRRAGHARSRAVQPSPRPTHDRAMAELEILVGLHKLFQLAQQHGLEEFLIDKLDETRGRLEMAVAAGSPERAVAELERWLAGQGEVT